MSPEKLPKSPTPNAAKRYPKRSMKFTIGSSIYTAVITPGPIVKDGEEYTGFTLGASREILIAGDCDPIGRFRVLLAQIARAWTLEVGCPRDADGWFELVSTVGCAACVELAKQGGEEALRAMLPRKPTKRAEARETPSRYRTAA